MRTLEEVKKLFEAQTGKSPKELVEWYEHDFAVDRYDTIRQSHDWEQDYEYHKKRMNGKDFIVEDELCRYVPNARLVWLMAKVDEHSILIISTKTRL